MEPTVSDLHDEENRRRYEERREKKRAYQRKWYAEHPDSARTYWFSERGREVRDRYYNSERGKEVRRKSYEKHKEKIRERGRLRAQTPEAKEYARQFNQGYYKSPLKRVHHTVCVAKARAKKDGLEFDPALFRILESSIPTHCPCCGVEIEYIQTKRGPRNPSLDRVDNTKGYIVGNAFITCWECNMLKRHGSIEDFERIIAYMRARITK